MRHITAAASFVAIALASSASHATPVGVDCRAALQVTSLSMTTLPGGIAAQRVTYNMTVQNLSNTKIFFTVTFAPGTFMSPDTNLWQERSVAGKGSIDVLLGSGINSYFGLGKTEVIYGSNASKPVAVGISNCKRDA